MENELNYTIGAEDIVAVDVHFENQIEKLINDVLGVDVGDSFAISIDALVNTMLPTSKEDPFKVYWRAANKLLARLNRTSGGRFIGWSFCCDEGRSIVYFGIKDEFGRIKIS